MKKTLLNYLSVTLLLITLSWQNGSAQTYHTLSSGSFSQDWSNTGLITVSDSWSGVSSIIGYRGDNGTSTTGVDPQTVVADLSGVIDVNANQTDGGTYTTGGVTEFHLTDPVVGLSGSGTADAPNLVIFLNTTGCSNIKVKYDLRDIDGSIDDAVQSIALQYRIGATGDYTNIPSGFVPDATTGPSLATLVTKVDAILPTACNNQAQVQIRIITTNANGNDEYIGIDNIVIEVDATAPVYTFTPANSATDVAINVTPTITFDEAVRKTDGNSLENADLASLITFKKTNSGGADVPFTATIDATKKVITVTPSSTLDNSQVYYLAVGPVEDASGNESTTSSASFTTIAAAAPTVTLTSPAGGETYYAGSPTTFTWTSANITNVKIEVWSPDNSRTYTWNPITASTPAAAGTFAFTVPSDLYYGTQYKIRISDESNAAVYSESGNFTCIPVESSLAALRTKCILNDIVKLSSEATVTYKRATGNQKYIQDATAGIIIYDPSAVLTTSLNIGDNFKDLEGKIAFYGGAYEIIPTATTVVVTTTGNTVTIPEMTLTEYNTNYLNYESELIKLSDVTFPTADGSALFLSNANTSLTDGTTTITFRTFATGESDIVGAVIPAGHFKMTCLGGFYNSTVQVLSRTLADFETLPTAVEKLSSDDLIKLFPNPASSVLNISNVKNLKSIEILDAAGIVVKTINTEAGELIQLPVDDLNKGIYMIRFNTGNVRTVKKFVKY